MVQPSSPKRHPSKRQSRGRLPRNSSAANVGQTDNGPAQDYQGALQAIAKFAAVFLTKVQRKTFHSTEKHKFIFAFSENAISLGCLPRYFRRGLPYQASQILAGQYRLNKILNMKAPIFLELADLQHINDCWQMMASFPFLADFISPRRCATCDS